MSNEKYVICDLDGCLIDSSWIWQVNKTLKLVPPECWEFFEQNANVSWNKIDETLLDFLKVYIKDGFKLFFLTARSDNIRFETIKFIEKRTGFVCDKDFVAVFRDVDDDSTPAEYKGKVIDEYKKNGASFEFAIDDDRSVIEMYKKKGITAVRWQIGFLPLEFIAENDVKSMSDDDLYTLFEDLIAEMNARKEAKDVQEVSV